MTKSVRRQPDMPGLAALTLADFARWKRKEVTLEDLATKCGVSKQAVSKWMRRMDGGTLSVPSTASCAVNKPEQGRQNALLAFTEDEALDLAKSGAFAVLLRAHQTLSGSGELGPSAIKAAGSAIGSAIDDLQRLGVIAIKEAPTMLTDLSVRMMTEEEEEALRRSREEEDT